MVGLYGKCMFNILRNGQLFCKVVVAVYELSDYSKSESICGQSIKNNFIVRVRGGFPDSSVSNESVCNAGDPGLIPGSGRSPGGGGIGCLLQYSWASLVSQMVKNPAAMQETWVQSLGREVPWRRAQQSTPVFLPGDSHGQRSLVGYSPQGHKESDKTERLTFSVSCRPNRSDVQNKGNRFLCPHFLPCSPPPTISGFARGLG